MRVVLDTNVLVAGMLSGAGAPGWLVEAVLTGQLEIALDTGIHEEYEDVLHRAEFGFPPGRVADLAEAIDRFAFRVAAAPPCPERLPDPDDERFLAVAAASGSILITGNLRHFPSRARRDVVVCSPREFLDRLRRERT